MPANKFKRTRLESVNPLKTTIMQNPGLSVFGLKALRSVVNLRAVSRAEVSYSAPVQAALEGKHASEPMEQDVQETGERGLTSLPAAFFSYREPQPVLSVTPQRGFPAASEAVCDAADATPQRPAVSSSVTPSRTVDSATRDFALMTLTDRRASRGLLAGSPPSDDWEGVENRWAASVFFSPSKLMFYSPPRARDALRSIANTIQRSLGQ